MAACSGASAQRDTVNSFFDAIKNDDLNRAKQYVMNGQELSTVLSVAKELKLDEDALLSFSGSFKAITYNILSAKEEETKTAVTVELSIPDYSKALEKSIKESDKKLDKNELQKNIIKSMSAQTPEYIDKTITVYLYKVNDKWLIDESDFELLNAINGNIINVLTQK